QELVSMIVGKAVKMAQLMNVPILGIVENMSYFICPDCGKEYPVFGQSHIEEIAEQHGIKNIARIPIHPKLAAAVDHGMIELFEGTWLDRLVDFIEGNAHRKIAVPYENGEIFQHFGHAEQFKLFEIEDGKITNTQLISSDCGGHGALAGFLENNGVSVLICGGIGGGAKVALSQANITVLAGVSGNADEQVNIYLDGNLAFNANATCDHHEEEHGEGGTCGNHGGSCGGGCH
ncbi:MAG: P-loop NTPase, partial [Anaerovorax sp.]